MARKSNIVYELSNGRKLNKNQFLRYFEKKVLYTIRKYDLIEKKDKVAVFCDNKESFVLTYVLERFCKQRGQAFMIFKKKPPKNYILAVADSLDDEAKKIMSNLFKKNPVLAKLGPKIGKIIRPFYFCNDREIMLYARLKKLSVSKYEKKRSNEIQKWLEQMDKKHIEVRNAVVASFLKIKPFLKP